MNEPKPEPLPVVKNPLTKDGMSLKIYAFTVQQGPHIILPADHFKAYLSYNDDMARELVRKDFPAGQPIHITQRAAIPVQEMMTKIDFVPEVTAEKPKPKPPRPKPIIPKTKEATVKEFVYGMMLVADKYVEDAQDRELLKMIVSKVKINESKKRTTAR